MAADLPSTSWRSPPDKTRRATSGNSRNMIQRPPKYTSAPRHFVHKSYEHSLEGGWAWWSPTLTGKCAHLLLAMRTKLFYGYARNNPIVPR